MSSNGTNYSNRTTLSVNQNTRVYARLAYNGEYGTATYIDVTKIDKVAPTNNAPSITNSTYNSATIKCEQTDAASGLDGTYSYYASKSNSIPSNPSWVTSSNNTYTFGSLESNTTYYFWTKVKDNAGNETVSSRATVKTEVKPPEPIPTGEEAITLSVDNPNWTNTNKTVTAVSSADPKYTVQMSSDGTNYSNRTTLVVDQNKRVYARLAYNGEYGTATYIDVTKIDKVKPSTDKPTVSSVSTNKATVKANQTDNSGGSGIKEYYFYMQEGSSLPSSPSWKKGTGATLEFTGLTESKTYYIWTRVIDNAGNEQVSASNNFKTNTPTEDPIPAGSSITLTVDNPDWTNRNKIVTAVSNEDAKYKVQMSLDGTSYTDGTRISVPENGKVYARYSYNGAFGSSTNITVTKIDKQKPSTDMPTVTKMESKKATLKCNQKDESGGSGINKQYFYISTNDTLPSTVEWIESENTISLEGLINHSTYYIWTKVTDNAGNEQISERNEFLLDKSEPIPKASEAISLTLNNIDWTNENKIVTAKKVKENSYEIQMSLDGTNYTNVTEIEVSENLEVFARLTDGYEYGEPTSIRVSKIDKVPPTNTAPNPNKVTTRYIYSGIKQVDNESGIEKALYRLTNVTGNSGTWQDNPVFDRLNQGETYYIQTYARDKAGNETYSEVTEVTMLTIPSGEEAIVLTPDVPSDVTTFLNVTVIASTDSDFDIQTSTNGKKYLDVDRQTLENNGIVYARLTDGYNYGEPVYLIVNNIQHLYPVPDETLFDLDDPPTLSTTVGDRWTNGDVTVISSRKDNYYVQTKLNDGEWEDKDRQVATQYGDKVYARYTDGYFYSPEVLLVVNNIDKEPPTNAAPSVQIVESNQDCIDITLNQVDELSGIEEKYTRYRVIDENNNSTPWQDSLRFDNLELYKRYFAQTYVVDRAGNEMYSEYTPFKIALYDDNGNLVDKDGNFVDEDGNIIKPTGQIDVINEVVNTTITEETTNTTDTTNNTNTTNTVVNNVVDTQDDIIEEHNEPVGQVNNDEQINNEPINNNEQEEKVDNPQANSNDGTQENVQNDNLSPVKGNDKKVVVLNSVDTSKVKDVPVGTSEQSIPKSGSPRKVGIIGVIVLLVGVSLYFYKKNDEYKY